MHNTGVPLRSRPTAPEGTSPAALPLHSSIRSLSMLGCVLVLAAPFRSNRCTSLFLEAEWNPYNRFSLSTLNFVCVS